MSLTRVNRRGQSSGCLSGRIRASRDIFASNLGFEIGTECCI